MNAESQKLFELLILMLSAGSSHAAMPHTQLPEVKVETVGEFRRGEGCVAGFRRLGYTVTVNKCIQIAHKAGVTVAFFSDERGNKTFDVLVHEGDPFAVVNRKGKREYVLYKRSKTPLVE